MGFFDYLARAFGFGPNVDETDPVLADTTDDTPRALPQPERSSAAETPAPIEFDQSMQNVIFERIVDVFNQSLPAFLAESVDREAQLRFLRGHLDQGVADYLAALNEQARIYCESQWQAKQNEMAAELGAIRLRAEEVEKRSDDIRQKQLSADRQKRALNERVHDLESKLASLQSEREQLELENRSLMVRMKSMSVQQEDVDQLRAEVTRYRENPELISKEREDALNEEIARLQAETAKFQEETAKLHDGIEALKDQIKIGDEIRDQLRVKLNEADSQLQQRTKEVEELNSLVTEFEAAATRMEQAEKLMVEANEAHAKEIAAKDHEIASLKETIAANIREQANREKALRDEIDELRESRIPAMTIDFGEPSREYDEETPTPVVAESEPQSDDADANADAEDENVICMISDDELTQFAASYEAIRETERFDEPEPADGIFGQNKKTISLKELPEEESEAQPSPGRPEAADINQNQRRKRSKKKNRRNDNEEKRTPRYDQPSLF